MIHRHLLLHHFCGGSTSFHVCCSSLIDTDNNLLKAPSRLLVETAVKRRKIKSVVLGVIGFPAWECWSQSGPSHLLYIGSRADPTDDDGMTNFRCFFLSRTCRRFSGGFGSRDYRTSQPASRPSMGSSRNAGGSSFPNYNAPPPSHGRSTQSFDKWW